MAFTPHSGATDYKTWRDKPSYQVKLHYEFLTFGGPPRFANMWKAGIPLKIRSFLWLVFHHKVLTRVAMQKRGWPGDTSCSFCQHSPEDASHLFLLCPNIQPLWEWACSRFPEADLNTSSLAQLWDSCCALSKQNFNSFGWGSMLGGVEGKK